MNAKAPNGFDLTTYLADAAQIVRPLPDGESRQQIADDLVETARTLALCEAVLTSSFVR